MPRYRRGFDQSVAHARLAAADHRLAAWMARVGPAPPQPGWRRGFDPVDALARAIVFQQLSGKAAATIVARVEAALGQSRLDAQALMRLDTARLRACGVSGNKVLALRDLAARALRGEVPNPRQLSWMTDAAIIQALVAIRGIGPWTAQVMLMFRLGRPDVLPADDLGIRKGVQAVDGLQALPTPREVAARADVWAPYRTYAGLQLWRIADHAASRATPVPRSQS